jgi:uncharacterized protein (TIGR01568 family)
MSRLPGRFELPEPPVVDVGCSCRTPRLLSSLVASLKSRARGLGGKPPKSSPHASTPHTAFTQSATSTATTASSLFDHASSWGPATFAALSANDAVYEQAEAPRREHPRRRRKGSKCRRREQGGWTVAEAVEVESAAPYEDFRESMVAMVMEREMYAWEDLNALLHQFLALNSPRHHPVILGAFADLWAPRGGLFCPPSPCLLGG